MTEVGRGGARGSRWRFRSSRLPGQSKRTAGPRFCPRNRPATAARISAPDAIERARELLADNFCGPNAYESGCDFDPEQAFDSWRVYAHQYKFDDQGRHVFAGRDHAYIVLDAVGNCLAHIPGTPLGARS